jgi:hypothetical protein
MKSVPGGKHNCHMFKPLLPAIEPSISFIADNGRFGASVTVGEPTRGLFISTRSKKCAELQVTQGRRSHPICGKLLQEILQIFLEAFSCCSLPSIVLDARISVA